MGCFFGGFVIICRVLSEGLSGRGFLIVVVGLVVGFFWRGMGLGRYCIDCLSVFGKKLFK